MQLTQTDYNIVANLHDILHLVYEVELDDENLRWARITMRKIQEQITKDAECQKK